MEPESRRSKDAGAGRVRQPLGQVMLPRLAPYRPVELRGCGVNYRIPLPGAKIEGGMLSANVRFPGMTIEYSHRRPALVGLPEAGACRRRGGWLRTKAVDGRTSRVARVPG